jgi:hypothetical protein
MTADAAIHTHRRPYLCIQTLQSSIKNKCHNCVFFCLKKKIWLRVHRKNTICEDSQSSSSSTASHLFTLFLVLNSSSSSSSSSTPYLSTRVPMKGVSSAAME